MSNMRSRVLFVSIAILITILAVPLFAQMTTGNIGGTVTAKQDSSALPGVTIEAVHVPTGTRYSGVSGGNGYFLIPNVRIGGPYKITGTLEGFKSATTTVKEVTVGETANVDVSMVAAVSEAITVTASVDPIINPSHTGSTSSVTEAQIETLPTVNRQIQDYARTNPYVVTSLTGDGTFMTIAGRNNRYNNIQLDGAVNNDLFGLAASGTPGGQAGTQPFSLDAIQQLQVVVSPYDVRQSGFTGGGINAVTRSGTNEFEGSVFGTKRDPSFVGKGPFNTKVGDFKQDQLGGRHGGPIIRDRLFYFVSGEGNNRKDPNGTSADGSTGIVYTAGTDRPDAAAVAAFMKSTYNYDPGTLGDLIFKTKSTLFLGKFDANLNNSNILTLRHNYVSANQDNAPSSFTRNSTRFYFPTNIYQFPSKTNSTVAQLNSVISQNAFNEGRLNITRIRESRSTPVIFPTVEIGPPAGTGGERNSAMQLGTERFSGANALNQDINEFTDDFTYTMGNHTLVAGTHNEMFKFANLFIQDFYGYYHFANFAALQAGTPDIYRIGYATGSDPKRPTRFKAAQYSLYLNDQIRMNSQWTFSLGLRADKPKFGTTPSFNQAVQTAIGFSTSAIPKEQIILEPRFGFNWDIGGLGKQQLRGGIGVFLGKAPYVWVSNNYGNTGIEQVLKGCTTASCMPAFNPNVTTQNRLDGVAGATQDIALSDPNFRFPRVLRTTLGYDRDLFWGIRGTGELLYSVNEYDVYYQNQNKKPATSTSPLDGRPTYTSIASTIGNAYYLTNTNKGNEFTQTIQLNKIYKTFTFTGSYAHQKAMSVGEGNSSTASSQWQFGFINRGDIFNPELTTSTFQVKHRFNIAATYNLNTGPLSHSFGVFYSAQSGNPYSLIMGGDPNKDGSGNNDLLYIPNDYILCPSTANAAPNATSVCRSSTASFTPLDPGVFRTFLSSVGLGNVSGVILKRNVLHQPWTRRLDFHYEIGLPQVFKTRVLVQADVLNLLNMFNKDWGVEKFVTNNTYNPVTYSGQDPTSGKPVYRESSSGRLTPGTQFSTANLGSRWQGRLGLRINF